MAPKSTVIKGATLISPARLFFSFPGLSSQLKTLARGLWMNSSSQGSPSMNLVKPNFKRNTTQTPLAKRTPKLALSFVDPLRGPFSETTMASKEFKALEEKQIHVGDVVRTQFRGGERKGVVKAIATTKEQHPHPPKVIFNTEKDGKEVAHNPSTLEKVQ